ALVRSQATRHSFAAAGENLDESPAASDSDADAVRLDLERGALVGNLQRADPRRVADQKIGGAQAHRVQRARNRHAQVLVARSSPALERGHEAGRQPPQSSRHARRSWAGVSSGARRSVPAAASAESRSYSRSDTGANVTLSPAASNAGGVRCISHRGAG